MGALKLMAFALIGIGALVLAYGGFTYTKETHTADFGPIQLSVDEKEHVSVPVWVGLGAVLLGGVLLVVRVRS
jgi:TRAP-type C4-dicarboxylate transport system permease small subunit